MFEKIQNAKHWQIFLLVFVLPFLFMMIFMVGMMVDMVSNIQAHGDEDPRQMFSNFAFIPLIILVNTVIHFSWFWSIGSALQQLIPDHVKLKVKRFKTFFFIPLIYILLLSVGMTIMFNELLNINEAPEPILIITSVAIFIPLHFFSIFCMIHTLWFCAKTLKTIELQKEAHFSDYIGDFFLIWFFPVGVWFIQPRINKMVESD